MAHKGDVEIDIPWWLAASAAAALYFLFVRPPTVTPVNSLYGMESDGQDYWRNRTHGRR